MAQAIHRKLKPLKGFRLPTMNRHQWVMRIASMRPLVDAYARFRWEAGRAGSGVVKFTNNDSGMKQ
jgi:hypothetical protein